MNNQFTEYNLKCDRCGAIKKGKTQNIELAKKITIDHKKCGGKFRFFGGETTTVEPEPVESKPAPKLESKEVDSPATSGTSEIYLAPIKKIDAIFQCDKCPALIKITGENIEKAEKLTFPHNQCQNPEKGAFRFLTIVGRVVDSSGQYSNEKIRKIKKFVCNICPYNPIGKWYKHVDPCPKPYDLLGVCYLENIEFRYLRSGNLAAQSTLQILDDVKDIIVTIGEDKKQVSLNDIKRLFIARFDRYSLQDPKAPEKFPDVKEPLTDLILLTGMLGGITIGTRAVNPENNKIKWICYDVDSVHNENPKLVVDTIVRCLKEWHNLTGHVEKSGSPDSYHVWVFLEPTDNDIAYEFDNAFKARLKAKLNSMGIKTVADSIDRGVSKGEGSMLKLPFNVQLKNHVRSEFLSDISKIQPERLPV